MVNSVNLFISFFSSVDEGNMLKNICTCTSFSQISIPNLQDKEISKYSCALNCLSIRYKDTAAKNRNLTVAAMKLIYINKHLLMNIGDKTTYITTIKQRINKDAMFRPVILNRLKSASYSGVIGLSEP